MEPIEPKKPHALKGIPQTPEHRQKIGDALRGKPKSDAHREALKRNHRGMTGKTLSEEHKAKLNKTGFHHSAETKEKISQSKKGQWTGPKNPNWKGGIANLHNQIRGSREYARWVRSVFERDNYICQMCLKKGGDLNAHHLKSFTDHPELRFDVNNGQTLCIPCHDIVTEALGQRKRRRRYL